MTTYNDSYNNGNPNYLNGSNGQNFTLGAGLDWFIGASNETLTYVGGLNISPYANLISFTGTNNTIVLQGASTDLFISEIDPTDKIGAIKGASSNNYIVASAAAQAGSGGSGTQPSGPTTLDLSATKLTGITAIEGNDHGDTIKGDGTGVPIRAGSGNDKIYENGPDNVDGGGGFNTYVANSNLASYQVTHSGATWSLVDSNGNPISLKNIQEVSFTDGPQYSGTALPPMTDADATANSVSALAANGSTVGVTASTTEPNAGATLTYSLVNGSNSPFTVNPSTGVVTVGNSSLLGSAMSYAVTVQATDGTLTTQGAFSVNETFPADLSGLTTTQAAALPTAEIAALTTTQVASLTPAEMAALTSTQVAALTTASAAALSSAQVAALGTAALGGLTPADTAALTPANVAALSPAQFLALPTQDVAALPTGQMAAVTAAQIAGLSTAQVAALSRPDVAALTTAQAVALTTTQIPAFTTAQITVLTTTALGAMTTAEAHAFTSTQTNVMTSAQIAALHY